MNRGSLAPVRTGVTDPRFSAPTPVLPVRAAAGWLALREPADAAARSADLAQSLAQSLARSRVQSLARRAAVDRPLEVHDLGCGTGSVMRWLAPRLPGRQHWVLWERDPDLLDAARVRRPPRGADGALVTVETRQADVTRLGADALRAAGLVTGSALLDMLTAAELQRLVRSCAAAACPVLLTTTVIGRVELRPAEPLDRAVAAAFDEHQRRTTAAGRLLGPDAAEAAVAAFGAAGLHVVTRPAPWRLGRGERALAAEWLTGWVDAACEQRPGLAAAAAPYTRRRLAQAADGGLAVTVHHLDLLATPPRRERS